MEDLNFSFEILSPKYGRFTVTAPVRFRAEIEARIWCVKYEPKLGVGRQFIPYWKPPARDGRQSSPVKLHQLIWSLIGRVGFPDHRDGQPLNNSEDNLRPATWSQNSMNRQRQSNNTSGRIGVSWHARTGKWMAAIDAHRKHHHLGLFDDLDEAARVRDEAARRLHGDFAVLNEAIQ